MDFFYLLLLDKFFQHLKMLIYEIVLNDDIIFDIFYVDISTFHEIFRLNHRHHQTKMDIHWIIFELVDLRSKRKNDVQKLLNKKSLPFDYE